MADYPKTVQAKVEFEEWRNRDKRFLPQTLRVLLYLFSIAVLSVGIAIILSFGLVVCRRINSAPAGTGAQQCITNNEGGAK